MRHVRIAVLVLVAVLFAAALIFASRAALLFVAAAVAVGLGFALQDVLRNLVGGLQILLDRPLHAGDLIDVAGVRGEIVAIGAATTRIRTRDDVIVSVPNALIVTQPVRNASHGAREALVVTTLLVPGSADGARVRRLAYEAAATSPYLFAGKPIEVDLADDFRETFLTRVSIRAHVYDHRLEGQFRTDVAERAKRALRDEWRIPDPLMHVPASAEPWRASEGGNGR